jgi:hypothetical protein
MADLGSPLELPDILGVKHEPIPKVERSRKPKVSTSFDKCDKSSAISLSQLSTFDSLECLEFLLFS